MSGVQFFKDQLAKAKAQEKEKRRKDEKLKRELKQQTAKKEKEIIRQDRILSNALKHSPHSRNASVDKYANNLRSFAEARYTQHIRDLSLPALIFASRHIPYETWQYLREHRPEQLLSTVRSLNLGCKVLIESQWPFWYSTLAKPEQEDFVEPEQADLAEVKQGDLVEPEQDLAEPEQTESPVPDLALWFLAELLAYKHSKATVSLWERLHPFCQLDQNVDPKPSRGSPNRQDSSADQRQRQKRQRSESNREPSPNFSTPTPSVQAAYGTNASRLGTSQSAASPLSALPDQQEGTPNPIAPPPKLHSDLGPYSVPGLNNASLVQTFNAGTPTQQSYTFPNPSQTSPPSSSNFQTAHSASQTTAPQRIEVHCAVEPHEHQRSLPHAQVPPGVVQDGQYYTAIQTHPSVPASSQPAAQPLEPCHHPFNTEYETQHTAPHASAGSEHGIAYHNQLLSTNSQHYRFSIPDLLGPDESGLRQGPQQIETNERSSGHIPTPAPTCKGDLPSQTAAYSQEKIGPEVPPAPSRIYHVSIGSLHRYVNLLPAQPTITIGLVIPDCGEAPFLYLMNTSEVWRGLLHDQTVVEM